MVFDLHINTRSIGKDHMVYHGKGAVIYSFVSIVDNEGI